jgi:hypothetical protein
MRSHATKKNGTSKFVFIPNIENLFLYSSPHGDGDIEVGGKRGVEEAEGWISY